MTERQKQNKLKKIERLKKTLKEEKRKFGGYHDGRGLRYEIAHKYFELGEHKLTNRYLNWFNKNFEDDMTYGFFQFGAAIARFRASKIGLAKKHLIRVNQHNTYLLDLVVNNEIKDQDKYEWSELETLVYAKKYLPDFFNLVNPEEIDWIRNSISEPDYKLNYKRYISIKKLIKGKEVSEERTKLLNAASKCLEQWLLETK